MKRTRIALAAVLFILLTAWMSPALATQFVLNGSFESFSASFPVGYHDIDIPKDSTEITNWLVTGAGVDLIRRPYWDVHYGDFTVDLSLHAPGGIEQQLFGFSAGQRYEVSFALSGNPMGSPMAKQLTVSVDDGTWECSFDSTGQSENSLVWKPITFSFVASGSTTTLDFSSLTSSSSYGPLIDNVSVTEAVESVPDPGSSLLLSGMGLVGLRAWRQRW